MNGPVDADEAKDGVYEAQHEAKTLGLPVAEVVPAMEHFVRRVAVSECCEGDDDSKEGQDMNDEHGADEPG